ncbi:MAG: hypothetical protein ACR2IL_11240 [Chitinophagaceae bacterium]
MEEHSSQKLVELIHQHKHTLKPTQLKLCLPIIHRLCKKMEMGVQFKTILVHDQLICDGHHRYVAALITNYNLDISPALITSATMSFNWEDVTFDEQDWDTANKINWLNTQDALFNNLPLEDFNALIK